MNSFISCLIIGALLFTNAGNASAQIVKKEAKPYKILSAGLQITIRSSKVLDKVMVWTTDGNRLVEQKDIKSTTITVTLPISRPYFFLMIGLTDGKIYTEKIAL
jgi:membrane-bound ClpP family serine protease